MPLRYLNSTPPLPNIAAMSYSFPKFPRWLRLGASHRSKRERMIVRGLLAFSGALLIVDLVLLSALF